MTATDEDLQHLRHLYAITPVLPPVPLEEIRRGARRRIRRRRLAVAGGASAAVVAAVTSFLVASPPASDGPDESSLAPQPSNGVHEMAPGSTDMRAATDAAYRALDSSSDTGYYMLRTDSDTATITLWGNLPGGTVADVREAVERTGAQLELRPLPENLDPHNIQPTADAASERMREATANPDYGFTQLKLQLPFRSVIIWRTTPDAGTDSELENIAREAGLSLEIRTSTVSRSDAEQTSAALRTENDRWESYGFQVLGCFARPSGLIVTVQGDTRAAERELVGSRQVIGVLDGELIYSTID